MRVLNSFVGEVTWHGLAVLTVAMLIAVSGCGGTTENGPEPVNPSFSIPSGTSWVIRMEGPVEGEVSGSTSLFRSGDPDRINLSTVDGGTQTSIDLYVPIPERRVGTYLTSRKTTLTREGTQYFTESSLRVTIEDYDDQQIRGAFRGSLGMRSTGGESAESLDSPVQIVGRFDLSTGQ